MAKANGRELVTDKSSARGKHHRNDFRLVVLQAKQKPRVLHRNKRYVVPHKNRHRTSDVLTQRPLPGNGGLGEGSGPVRVCNTCVFSLALALFVASDKRVRL